MKVLFVCKYNIGRSRMAEAIFNKFSKKNHADSCGVCTYYYLKKFNGKVPVGDPVLKVASETGLDITKKKIKQINRKLVENSDIIIAIMTKERAKKDIQKYVKNNKKFRLWELEDVSGTMKFGSAYKKHKINRDKIYKKVTGLIKKIG